jgi:hypothetical protein
MTPSIAVEARQLSGASRAATGVNTCSLRDDTSVNDSLIEKEDYRRLIFEVFPFFEM